MHVVFYPNKQRAFEPFMCFDIFYCSFLTLDSFAVFPLVCMSPCIQHPLFSSVFLFVLFLFLIVILPFCSLPSPTPPRLLSLLLHLFCFHLVSLVFVLSLLFMLLIFCCCCCWLFCFGFGFVCLFYQACYNPVHRLFGLFLISSQRDITVLR